LRFEELLVCGIVHPQKLLEDVMLKKSAANLFFHACVFIVEQQHQLLRTLNKAPVRPP